MFPLSPVKSGLSPVPVGTDLFNGDNDLQAFLPFVPTVPTIFRHGCEEDGEFSSMKAPAMPGHGPGSLCPRVTVCSFGRVVPPLHKTSAPK